MNRGICFCLLNRKKDGYKDKYYRLIANSYYMKSIYQVILQY